MFQRSLKMFQFLFGEFKGLVRRIQGSARVFEEVP